MRRLIKKFAKICTENLPILEPIYEFGSLQVPTQIGFADLRSFFPGKKYVGTDMREGPGVDIILNLHDINLPSESVGTALILDTLEHVEFPREAVNEAHRILKANGILIISSQMKFPIHSHPYDYWRFTPEAFKSLLKPFDSCFVDFEGERLFPHTVVGVGFKGSVSKDIINAFEKELQNWKEDPKINALKNSVKLIVPPIFVNIYQKIKKFNQ